MISSAPSRTYCAAGRSVPSVSQCSSGGVWHVSAGRHGSSHVCFSKVQRRGSDQEDHQYDYSDPVNKFLGRFLPKNSNSSEQELGVDFNQPKLRGLSVGQMAELVEQGLSSTQWFVTGKVDAMLFSDTFAFKDESVSTKGIKAYATGVRKLFDQATSKAELITVQAKPEAKQIVVTWRLEGRVNLPLKPKIKPYIVTTTLGLDDEGLICSQLDEFSAPGWDLLLSIILGDRFGQKPAAPVEEFRQAAAAVAESAGKAAAAHQQ
eukprot:GHRR01014459.1.p1 GENE.GHRR01014459.1~~GHRR01014459.1.p1  ORF type:complete len:263 (+),score=71.81 GHRR01014459.1:577-1365(+)